jgi:hypothetical protein
MTSDTPLRDVLRQMLALLEGERQALAGLDTDGILTCSTDKIALCEMIERHARRPLDEECRGLLDAIARLNEINRKIRNLTAANVEARLGSIAGRANIYGAARPTSIREISRHV